MLKLLSQSEAIAMAAAIVAQYTFRRRANRMKKRRSYSASKCLYQLKPFDARFDPFVHNEFLARRKKRAELLKNDTEKEMTETEKELIKILNQKQQMQAPQETLSSKRILVELFIIGTLFIKVE